MKNCLIYLLILFSIVPLSCQKGDNDPALSLRTRKNRLTGTWEIESYEFNASFGDIRSISYDPTLGLVYESADSLSYSRTFSWEMVFDGDGLYSSIKNEDFPEDSINGSEAYKLTSIEKGIWEFTGGNDSPSKSKLAFFAEENSSTRTDQGSNIDITVISNTTSAFVYDIDRLTNKELWLTYDIVQTSAFEEQTESIEIKFVKTD